MKPNRLFALFLRQIPLLLLGLVLLAFGLAAPRFLSVENLLNIGVQAAPAGIVAVGMTFVLLSAGVDLSVGAMMFVTGAVAGKMALAGYSLPVIVVVMLGLGVALGGLNAIFITRAKVAPFIVTLAFLFIGRGFALWLTQTRAMNLPENFFQLGSASMLGVPLPLACFAALAVFGHFVLKNTPVGRQIHAVGHHAGTARKAGINVPSILTVVYLFSGICAALAAMLALAQLGAVTPKFGENYEFKAISAAVLGGTSLFGGRGAILPGTVLGVVLIQSIENGLVLMNADPYLYPLITSAIIFSAMLLDTARGTLTSGRGRRLTA